MNRQLQQYLIETAATLASLRLHVAAVHDLPADLTRKIDNAHELVLEVSREVRRSEDDQRSVQADGFSLPA